MRDSDKDLCGECWRPVAVRGRRTIFRLDMGSSPRFYPHVYLVTRSDRFHERCWAKREREWVEDEREWAKQHGETASDPVPGWELISNSRRRRRELHIWRHGHRRRPGGSRSAPESTSGQREPHVPGARPCLRSLRAHGPRHQAVGKMPPLLRRNVLGNRARERPPRGPTREKTRRAETTEGGADR